MHTKRLVILFSVLVLSLLFTFNQGIQAQSQNLAGLVIQFGDGSAKTFCISFDEESITGYDLLVRSELNVEEEFGPMGAAICKIDFEGCPADDCFCASPPDYWSYWHIQDGDWVYSVEGVSNYEIHNGSVDGWTWGSGDPPDHHTFESICSKPTPTNFPPTHTATIPTSIPTASWTVQPTPSPSRTNSPTPTNTRVPPTTTTILISSNSSHTPLPSSTQEPATGTPLPSPTFTLTNISTEIPLTVTQTVLVQLSPTSTTIEQTTNEQATKENDKIKNTPMPQPEKNKVLAKATGSTENWELVSASDSSTHSEEGSTSSRNSLRCLSGNAFLGVLFFVLIWKFKTPSNLK